MGNKQTKIHIGIACVLFASTAVLAFMTTGPQLLPEPSRPTDNSKPAVTPPSGRITSGLHTVATTHQVTSPSEPPSADTPAAPVLRAKDSGKTVIIDDKPYPLRTYAPLAIPNDPYANQWWVQQTNLPAAWDTPRGTHQTLIAVIDTGFGLDHEDLRDRWYTNTSETGPTASEGTSVYNCTAQGKTLNANCNLVDDDVDGIVDNEVGTVGYENPSQLTCTAQLKPINKDCNRLDDDSNGYIDDVKGWDFINQDASVQAGQLSPTGTGTTHGTMVAGVAAATNNNARGIAGVDGGAKILPIQAVDDDSYGDTRSVGRAIRYAAKMGADIISLSLGSSLPDPYVRESVLLAIKSGAIVVAASGNDGCECIIYPANYPEVLAVGALAENGAPATFSSWGANLDILAPGSNITTPTWIQANGTSRYASGAAGTSFSTPLVSGMISRLLSQQPNATALQLRSMVIENTNKLNLGLSLRSTTLGYGTLDANKSTLRASQPYNPHLLYGFSPISQGNYLNSSQPVEISSGQVVYQCSQSNYASTPIYELKKGSDHFFTASESELYSALTTGYMSSVFMYGCMQLPHDRPTTIRNINIFPEFKNILFKI